MNRRILMRAYLVSAMKAAKQHGAKSFNTIGVKKYVFKFYQKIQTIQTET